MATKLTVTNKQNNFAELIMTNIRSGIWCCGERLKPERMLAEEFKLSRTTVRESLKMLLELGVVTRRGKFTFISEDALAVIESLRYQAGRRLVVVLDIAQMDNPIYKTIFSTIASNMERTVKVQVLFIDNYPESLTETLCDEDIVMFLGKRPEPQIQVALKHTSNIILVNSFHPECHSVIPDNVLGGKLMAEHLYKNGHTRIGAVFLGTAIHDEFSDRFTGARTYLMQHNIELHQLPELPRMEGETDIQLFQRAFLELWETVRPSGIICQRDGVALPLYEMLQSRGVNIPEDISIVGFDDQLYASYATPPLTTVRYPTNAIGMEIISIIKHILAGNTKIVREKIPPRLFRRESVASVSKSDTKITAKRMAGNELTRS